MPSNTATKNKEPREKKAHKERTHKEKSHKEKSHKEKTPKAKVEFKATAKVEGKVPINPNDEVGIQGAREILEMRTQKNLGKPYKVSVMGTDTQLIIKKKGMASGPKEMSLYCNEVYRFFIFIRDPSLVILVVPDDCESKKAYMLLRMKNEADANRVCNVIQNGRKVLSAQAPQSLDPMATSSKTVEKDHVQQKEHVQEMQESKTESGKPITYKVDGISGSDSDSDSSEDSVSMSRTKKSNTTPTSDSKSKSPARTPVHDENEITPVAKSEVHSAYPAMMNGKESPNSDYDKNYRSPKSLPRKALHDDSLRSTPKSKNSSNHRRDAPHIEEMYVEPPKNWKAAQPIFARREDELRQVLRADRYDEDWAVDVKLIQTDGDFGSRLSETGNVYMFTAHHLVPENHSRFDCSSSSDEEIVLHEKPTHYSRRSSRSSKNSH